MDIDLVKIKGILTNKYSDFYLRENKVINLNNDVEYYQHKFKENGWVKISNYLKNDKADLIYDYLNSDNVNWIYSLKWDGSQNKNIIDNDQNLLDLKFYIDLVDQNFYQSNSLTYRFRKTISHPDTCPIINCRQCQILKFFNSDYFVKKMSFLTSKELSKSNEIFASYYQSGDFLSKHSDDISDRKIAFVYQLTKNWDATYGGNLHFLDSDWNNIEKVLVPEYNSLYLFDVTNRNTPHFVSHIAPSIQEKRLAITGWYE